MLYTILGALLPIVVTFLLGFVAAWRHDFGPKDASMLNRMVLGYAVPLALFAGTVSASRAELSQDIPLLITLCVAIIGLYGVVFLLSRFAFRIQVSTSALAALTASAPAVPFMGPAILGNLFGRPSAIPIALAGLVINLTVVPVTILLLTLNTADGDSQGKSSAAQDRENSASPAASHLSVLGRKLAETVKEPIVWAPVLAFVIVLSGAHIPQLIVHALSLLGHASGGVALFASGIVLASGTIKVNWHVLCLVFLKNIVQPAMVLGGLRWLGHGNPIVSEAALTTAIPTMPIVIMLAVQYRVAEAEAASAVFLSVIGSVITMGVFIALTS
jgi:malonate transporter and related proteins